VKGCDDSQPSLQQLLQSRRASSDARVERSGQGLISDRQARLDIASSTGRLNTVSSPTDRAPRDGGGAAERDKLARISCSGNRMASTSGEVVTFGGRPRLRLVGKAVNSTMVAV
jgi:hypothetical protein